MSGPFTDAAALRSTLDAVPDAVFVADLERRVKFASRGAERVFGRPLEELLGRTLRWLYADPEEWERQGELRFRPGGDLPGSYLMDYRRADGSVFPGETVASPLRDEAGEQIGFMGLIRDVTVRERAVRNVTRFQRLFQVTNSMAAIAGFDGYFKVVNEAWSSLLGYSQEELLSRPFVDFVHPDDVEATQRVAAQLVLGEEVVSFLNRYRSLDGSYRWLSWRSRSDTEQALIYAFAFDVTEMIEVRERLQRSERLLSQTERLARVGGWVLDLPTSEVTWSDEVYRIHEVERDFELTLESALDFYPGEVRARVRGALEQTARGGEPTDITVPFVTARGRRIWVRAQGEAVRDEQGQVVRLQGTFQDVSEQKAAETAKDEFVSVVSHELRTPLTSILGSLRLLEGGVMGELAPEVADLVRTARSNSERLVRLINEVLDLQRIEAKLDAPRLEVIELDELLEACVSELAGFAREREVKLSVAERANSGCVRGNPDRLLQVLVNLVGNAIKFSPAGEEVHLGNLRRSGTHRIEVRDRGPGVPVALRDTIFERFQQADSSDSRRASGTGLGLAIARAIVEQHGGRIGVRTRAGGGSVFFAELPAHGQDAEPSLSDSSLRRGGEVLVCVPDPLGQRLHSLLAQQGFRVTRTEDPEQLLALAEERAPEVVLAGPQLDGLHELAARLPPATATLFVSALREGEHATLFRWTPEPVATSRLVDVVRQACSIVER